MGFRILRSGEHSKFKSLHEKSDHRTQSLISLTAVLPGQNDKLDKPAAPFAMYDALGLKAEFVSSPSPVTLRTTGPFAASEKSGKPPKVHDYFARTTLDQGFLGLGLDRMAVATWRLSRLDKAQVKGAYWVGTGPPSAAAIIKAKKANEYLKITPEEERSIAGGFPAMISFFNVIEQTEGLNNILFKVVQTPSIWTIIKSGGNLPVGFQASLEQLGPADTTGWGLPAGPVVYRLPVIMQIDKKPALKLTFLVTAPQPPLLACAGIVGVLAEKPDDNETYLTLRIISAHRAGGKL